MSGIVKVTAAKKVMPPIEFQARHGLTDIAQLAIIPALSGTAGVGLISLGQDYSALGYYVVGLGALACALYWMFVHTRVYVITADGLEIHRGIFQDRVPLARIRSAILTGDPDTDQVRKVRLTLDSGRRTINPERRGEFIRVLKERAYL